MALNLDDIEYQTLAKFEVVELGCHILAQNILSNYFSDPEVNIETFQFVEYFLLTPLTRTSSSEDGFIFFPFLRRMLDKNQFIPAGEQGSLSSLKPLTHSFRHDIEMVQNEQGNDVPRKFILPLQNADFGKSMFIKWKRAKDLKECYFNNKYTINDWKGCHNISTTPCQFRAALQHDYDLTVRFWKSCVDNVETWVASLPIASNNLFYGYYSLIYPKPLQNTISNSKWGNISNEKLCDLLINLTNNYYLPTLCLLQNSIVEQKLYNIIKGNKSEMPPKNLKDKMDSLPISQWNEHSDNIFEQKFYYLWANRKKLLDYPGGPEGVDKIRRSLLLRKYNLASPKMIDEVKKILIRSSQFNQPEEHSSLVSAIVYGEPGSGKETMSNLIPLFTNFGFSENNDDDKSHNRGYFGLDVNIVNMAALKPNAIVGPLLLGANPNIRNQTMPQNNLMGIFTLSQSQNVKISKNEPQEPEFDGMIKSPPARVFILDELNSLDIDLQGILLRVLENGEVTPLFDIRNIPVQHFIIGVVNEDPDDITKKKELEALTMAQEFLGKPLAKMFYDFMIEKRRLRYDLYLRMARGLYLKIPPLRDRREDIPILFYFECLEAIEEEVKAKLLAADNIHKFKCNLFVEYAAYELLMKPEISWPGNIRQLQAVSREVAGLSAKNNINKNNPTIRVTIKQVEKALIKFNLVT